MVVLTLEEWQEQYFIPTSKVISNLDIDLPGMDLTSDIDSWLQAEYNDYVNFENWKELNFPDLENKMLQHTKLFEEAKDIFNIDLNIRIQEVLKAKYEQYKKYKLKISREYKHQYEITRK